MIQRHLLQLHLKFPFISLQIDWNIYVEPFRTQLWALLSSMIAVLTVLILAIRLFYHEGGGKGGGGEDEVPSGTFMEGPLREKVNVDYQEYNQNTTRCHLSSSFAT